jgi:hypothetical protein
MLLPGIIDIDVELRVHNASAGITFPWSVSHCDGSCSVVLHGWRSVFGKESDEKWRKEKRENDSVLLRSARHADASIVAFVEILGIVLVPKSNGLLEPRFSRLDSPFINSKEIPSCLDILSTSLYVSSEHGLGLENRKPRL